MNKFWAQWLLIINSNILTQKGGKYIYNKGGMLWEFKQVSKSVSISQLLEIKEVWKYTPSGNPKGDMRQVWMLWKLLNNIFCQFTFTPLMYTVIIQSKNSPISEMR